MPRRQRRQVIKYTFYQVDPAWRRRPPDERLQGKEEFVRVVEKLSASMVVRSYSLAGLRGDADFLLWCISPTLESVQQMATQIACTRLGRYLATPYSYLAMSRPSPYVGGHRHAGQEGVTGAIRPADRKYLFVYPFVKTHAWYRLPLEERQRMMEEHFRIGHKYPSVKINTSYSFGLDDQDFVLGFETDSAEDFLELVMELRGAEQRPFTERDTPIFACIRRPLRETLESLGG